MYDASSSLSSLYVSREPRYTGKERDAESGLDHFHFRSYASSMGRWTSPDPGWFIASHLSNPQSWNQYAYVLNNPLGYTDPLGLCGGAAPAGETLLGKIGGAIGGFFCNLFGGGGGGGSTAGAGGSGGGAGGAGYPNGNPFNGYLVPTRSYVEPLPKHISVLRNFWELKGPNGENLPKKYGAREYINGFDPGGEDNNTDGSHSDRDNVAFNSPPNQYDDTLGCPGGMNCQNGKFWQRFTVTLLNGPDKGTEVPVLMKINGVPQTAVHWQNNGRNATTPADVPGATLPGSNP